MKLLKPKGKHHTAMQAGLGTEGAGRRGHKDAGHSWGHGIKARRGVWTWAQQLLNKLGN